MKSKRCNCGSEQWAWFWNPRLGSSPIIFCEVCDKEYSFDELLDAFLEYQAQGPFSPSGLTSVPADRLGAPSQTDRDDTAAAEHHR